MPLSEHEQRLLDQIESALYAEDPKFASNVRGSRVRTASRRRRLQAVFLFVLGIVVLVSGVAFGQSLATVAVVAISVVGFLMMFGAAVVLVTGRGPAGGPDTSTTSGRPGSQGGSSAPGGFSSRMEERFKRRFDQP